MFRKSGARSSDFFESVVMKRAAPIYPVQSTEGEQRKNNLHESNIRLCASFHDFFRIIGANCTNSTPSRIRQQPMSVRPVRV